MHINSICLLLYQPLRNKHTGLCGPEVQITTAKQKTHKKKHNSKSENTKKKILLL